MDSRGVASNLRMTRSPSGPGGHRQPRLLRNPCRGGRKGRQSEAGLRSGRSPIAASQLRSAMTRPGPRRPGPVHRRGEAGPGHPATKGTSGLAERTFQPCLSVVARFAVAPMPLRGRTDLVFERSHILFRVSRSSQGFMATDDAERRGVHTYRHRGITFFHPHQCGNRHVQPRSPFAQRLLSPLARGGQVSAKLAQRSGGCGW